MPFAFLLPLLRSRWTWYAGAAIALVAALLFVRSHYIHVGEGKGREAQAQDTQQQVELQRKAAAAQLTAAIKDADARAAEADARAGQANAAAATYALQVQQITGRLVAARAAVNALPDAGLHPHVVAVLGLRQPNDQTPGYTISEEREIARRVDAAPILEQSNTALTGQVAKLADSISALSDQVRAVQDSSRARAAYTAQLEGWYTQLYNLHPPKSRGAKCVWLWRCNTDRLSVPAPKELEKVKP